MFHTVTECPECTNQFMVPTPDDIKLPTERVKFVCPHCRRKLSATPEQFGTRMPCPSSECDGVIDIPDPAWKVIKLPS